jgi:hypothetical protein
VNDDRFSGIVTVNDDRFSGIVTVNDDRFSGIVTVNAIFVFESKMTENWILKQNAWDCM